MRKIDVFNHIFPARYVERMMDLASTMKDVGKRVRNVPMLANLDVRFEIMDAHPEYQQILSIATPPVEVFAGVSDAVDLAQRANDGMAELVNEYPDRFPAFIAWLPMNDVDAAMRELERAMGSLRDEESRSARTSRASRSTCPSTRRSLRQWPRTISRSGCTRTAARTSPTIRRKNARSSKSGGRSVGPTSPVSPCRDWSSRASSIDTRTSRSSRTTWAG